MEGLVLACTSRLSASIAGNAVAHNVGSQQRQETGARHG